MSLVKWFRKNNKKLMVTVIFIAIIGFVIAPLLRQLGPRGRGPRGLNEKVGYIGGDTEITRKDMRAAVVELELLKRINADMILKGIMLRMYSVPNVHALILGELLFSDRQSSVRVSDQIEQLITRQGYRISVKELGDIYKGLWPSHLYWYLLKTEARQAGIRISNESAASLLGQAVSQLFGGATYSQVIGQIVKRDGVSEEKILETFAKLMAVLEYAEIACSTENITEAQLRQMVSFENEAMDVEFVKFDSTIFAEDQKQPSDEQIAEHFEKYKNVFAGSISEENPYGFGYRFADRAELEYIAVQFEDIESIVTAPTQEEAEEFYQKNRERFVEQIAADVNDPNSSPTEREQSFAEVADFISEQLLWEKISSKAEMILLEAKMRTEAGLDDIGRDRRELSDTEFAQLAGDYKAVAEQLSKEYNVPVYTGKTDLLSAADMQADEYLRRLLLPSAGYGPLRLPEVVFAVEQLGSSELGVYDSAKPRMYENIGLLKDMAGEMMVVLRIVKAEKSAAPGDINQTFNSATLLFDQDEAATAETYSAKEMVAEDLKRLAAMKAAKARADDFVTAVAANDWDTTVDKFNRLYEAKKGLDANEPNNFISQNITGFGRLSDLELETKITQNIGSPLAHISMNNNKRNAQFIDKLYSLIPPDANSLEAVPYIVESKPSMSYYCLKSLNVNRVNRDDYEKIKALRIYREDVIDTQSLGAVHFRPENILERMNFRQEEADANEPAKPEGAS